MEYDTHVVWDSNFIFIFPKMMQTSSIYKITVNDRTLYLLRLDNDNTSQVIAKYAHVMFQKRKQILSQKIWLIRSLIIIIIIVGIVICTV